MSRKLKLAAATLASAVAFTVASVSPASAHVTVNPGTAKQGGYGVITVRVPSEKPNANTTKVEFHIPTDNPITSVRVEPKPGWTYVTETTTLTTPVSTDHNTSTEAISKITWTADEGAAIKPTEFAQFNVSMGPLPKTESVVFKALQTYSDGDVVRWIEEQQAGGPEPEKPAPVLKLTADGTSNDSPAPVADAADKDDVDSARNLGVIALVVGVIALVSALGSFAIGRKK